MCIRDSSRVGDSCHCRTVLQRHYHCRLPPPTLSPLLRRREGNRQGKTPVDDALQFLFKHYSKVSPDQSSVSNDRLQIRADDDFAQFPCLSRSDRSGKSRLRWSIRRLKNRTATLLVAFKAIFQLSVESPSELSWRCSPRTARSA